MTTLAQSFGSSTALTVNATAWTQATTISTDAVNVAGLATIPVDVMISVTATVPNSTLGAAKAINVYVAVSEDGTHYTDNDQYSGSNNSQTALRAPTNFLGPFVIPCTQNVAAWGVIPSLRTLCGGVLPRKFGVVLENQTNVTLTSPAATFTPINFPNS
jgi:hypothetical protein